MIYLVLKIFIYLFLALLAGAGAGWLLRHLSAARQEEEMQRTLADVRARVPQFESLIRSRDEQINRLKDDLKDKDTRINALLAELRDAQGAQKEAEREIKSLRATHADQMPGQIAASAATPGDDLDLLPAHRSAPIGDPAVSAPAGDLEKALAEARTQAANATAQTVTAEAEVARLKTELETLRQANSMAAESDGLVPEPVEDLRFRLRQKAEEYELLAKELADARERVTELERERELQNKSLRVLHQQLELERERSQRRATG